MTDLNLKIYQDEITRWFKESYLGEDGLPVFRISCPDVRSGRRQNLLADLGDYLPFLLWCGEEDFVQNQLRLAEKFFRRGKFIFLEENERGRNLTWKHQLRCLILGKSVISFDYSDLLLGLIECYEIKKEEKVLLFIEYMVDKIYKMFYCHGALSASYYPRINYKLPLARSTNGIFLELFVDLYRLTGDKKYLILAEGEADFWVNREFFKNYGLFPHIASINGVYIKRWAGYGDTERTAFLAKDNCCLASGLLTLFRVTGKENLKHILKKWLEAVIRYFVSGSGAVYGYVKFDSDNNWYRKSLTLKSYALIDFLCDYHWITEDESFLQIAEKVAEFYVAKQSPETGLIPDGEREKESYFDSETDFGVSLMKLFERTGKEKYRESARRILGGQLKYHRNECGYVNRVNIFTGAITDVTVETRYVSLFLKLILLFMENRKIYQDMVFYNLLRDR